MHAKLTHVSLHLNWSKSYMQGAHFNAKLACRIYFNAGGGHNIYTSYIKVHCFNHFKTHKFHSKICETQINILQKFMKHT